MVAVKDADFSNVDAVFCCLPHGTTQVPFDLLSPTNFTDKIDTFRVHFWFAFVFLLPVSYIWAVASWSS